MKNKIILCIPLPILLAVIIAVVIAILYFTTDIFRSDNELFAKYFVQNGEILDIIENANIEAQKQFKDTNTYTSNGDLLVTIQNGENIQEVKATTSSRYDASTGRLYSDMALKNGQADILKVSYINSGDVYAIKCDDILANYIGIRNSDLKTFARNMGMSEAEVKNIPDSIDLSTINSIGKITEEQKQHIVDTYSKVIIESISEDKFAKKGKKQISVDGTSYKANAYQLTLDESTLKQILINCLSTLKQDNITLKMISSKISYLDSENEYTDIAKISEQLDGIITELQNSDTGNNSIEITVYEAKGQTVKTVISISNAGKITIDKNTSNELNKAIIYIEDISGANYTNAQISRITLQKNVTDSNITNVILIIPDTTNISQSIELSTTIGKVQNNSISNSSDIIINSFSDEANTKTISASYVQNIQAVAQVEEIMELKNSNTIIVNNYAAQQLAPFLEQIGKKISEVIPNKIAQLGINLGTATYGENVE